jgi:hypothetical protein
VEVLVRASEIGVVNIVSGSFRWIMRPAWATTGINCYAIALWLSIAHLV